MIIEKENNNNDNKNKRNKIRIRLLIIIVTIIITIVTSDKNVLSAPSPPGFGKFVYDKKCCNRIFNEFVYEYLTNI